MSRDICRPAIVSRFENGRLRGFVRSSKLERMFESLPDGAADPVTMLADAVTVLQRLDLAALGNGQLLELLRQVETQKARLAAIDHALVAEVDQRGVAADHGCRDTAVLLRHTLRIDPGEAAGRVRAARALGPRRGLTGEPLAPVFPTLAAACAAGAVSARHARVITATVDALPSAVAAEHDTRVEAFLTEQAAQFDPQTLARIARRLADTLDPDGTLTDARDRQRRRELNVRQRRDGSARVEAELTAICAEALVTVLDTLARPRPADNGAADPRSPGQRRHDALHDTLLTLLRSDQLPACGGVAATILLTATTDQLAHHRGLVRTGHGALIPAEQALTLIGDAQLLPVVFANAKKIDAYGSTQRIFTAQQRLAMAARDLGCSFPGCDIGPAGCQAHHLTDYTITRRTRIDDGTLLCGFHQREHQRLGRQCRMIDGSPHWIPPGWIDPDQAPRRNHAHDPAPAPP